MDRIDIHEDLCAELHKLYVAKNTDYGDSFAKVREEIPNAILVRLSDKLNRLKSLMTKDDDDRKVRDESIDDTLMDIANYALLELVERRNESDYYDDEEDEKESSHTFSSISDAVKEIQKTVRKACRNGWIDSENRHIEIFATYEEDKDRMKVVTFMINNGEVVDSKVEYINRGDDISIDSNYAFLEDWDDDDSED